MKFKRFIISLLVGLMLLGGCTVQGPSPVIEEFPADEKILILKNVLAMHHMKEKYQIPVQNNGFDTKVVASSFRLFDKDGVLKLFPKLKEFMSTHDDYLGDTPLRHPVYGPVVFDASALNYGNDETLYYVAFIDGNCGNFQVQTCESVEFKNGSLNAEIGIYISTGGASYDMTPTLIIIEIEGANAKGVKSAGLTFIPKADRIDD